MPAERQIFVETLDHGSIIVQRSSDGLILFSRYDPGGQRVDIFNIDEENVQNLIRRLHDVKKQTIEDVRELYIKGS